MSLYHLGREFNKYFTEKYGKNFERAEKKYELIYKLHYIFCIFLIIYVQFIENSFEIIFIFGIEIIVFLLLMVHPSFSTVWGIILPSLGMLIYIIVLEILIKINNSLKLNINIDYSSSFITVILNLVANTFIIRRINKQNKLIEISLKVNNKIPLDYECSTILFEDNNGNNYFINTDLDEKFNQGQLYEVKLKNKNISSKSVNIQGKEVYEIKEIDANCFKHKVEKLDKNSIYKNRNMN